MPSFWTLVGSHITTGAKCRDGCCSSSCGQGQRAVSDKADGPTGTLVPTHKQLDYEPVNEEERVHGQSEQRTRVPSSLRTWRRDMRRFADGGVQTLVRD